MELTRSTVKYYPIEVSPLEKIFPLNTKTGQKLMWQIIPWIKFHRGTNSGGK